MKKVIITGANGFIGKALVRKLLKENYCIYAVVKNLNIPLGIENQNLKVIPLNFSQYEKMASIIQDTVDWVIHLAWEGIYGTDSRNLIVQSENIKASCMVLEQAKKLKAKKFLFVGSSYQYRMEPLNCENQQIYVMKNIYGTFKKAASLCLRSACYQFGIDFNCISFTNVFGVGDYSKRSTNLLLSQLLRKEPLRLIPGNHKHDWVYIDDAVNGIFHVLQKGTRGTDYYIGHRNLKTFKEIITEVRNILAPEVDLQFECYPNDGYIDYSQIDLERLYADTEFECKSDFQDSILKTAEWVKKLEQEKLF